MSRLGNDGFGQTHFHYGNDKLVISSRGPCVGAITGRLPRMDATDPSIEGVTWWAYVRQHQGADTNAATGVKIGISGSAVGRWKSSTPDPPQVAAFARSYGRPVLEAFVAAGYLTPEEANERPSARPSLAQLSDDDLLEEVRRRMQGGQQWSDNTGPEDDGPTETERRLRESAGAQIRPTDEPRLTIVEPADDEAPAGTQPKAARTDKTGEVGKRKREADELGTESQDPGGMEPS